MRLHQALPEHVDSVFAIIEENAHWLLSKGIVQWPLSWLESEKENIHQSVIDGHYFHSSAGQKLMAVVEITARAEALWDNDLSKALYVHKLAIRREYSGDGLGLRILDEIKNRGLAEGICFIRLDCVAHNWKLRRYYEGCGFKLIKVKNNGVVDLALYEFRL